LIDIGYPTNERRGASQSRPDGGRCTHERKGLEAREVAFFALRSLSFFATRRFKMGSPRSQRLVESG
jgi:hypothetical protein